MGEYVTEPHTYEHFKGELWFPRLSDRFSYAKWASGDALTLGEKAAERARALIEDHTPEPLEETIREKIDQIVKKACS